MTGGDTEGNPWPYPVQVDLDGDEVRAYSFLGLPVYRKGVAVRDFQPQRADMEQVNDT